MRLQCVCCAVVSPRNYAKCANHVHFCYFCCFCFIPRHSATSGPPVWIIYFCFLLSATEHPEDLMFLWPRWALTKRSRCQQQHDHRAGEWRAPSTKVQQGARWGKKRSCCTALRSKCIMRALVHHLNLQNPCCNTKMSTLQKQTD